MSNFKPLANKGLWMYSLTTIHYFCFCNIYYAELDNQIPFPWELLWGFTIYQRSYFSFYALSMNILDSLGKMKVWGKKLYSLGILCFIFDRFCSIRSFLAISKVLGKWFIFWYALSCWYSDELITPLCQRMRASWGPVPSTKPFSSKVYLTRLTFPLVNLYLYPLSFKSISKWLPPQFLKIRNLILILSTIYPFPILSS